MNESKYIVSLWPGVGYYTKQIEVTAFSEEQALEAALAYCQANGLDGLYYECEEIDDDDELTDDEKDELYLYVDPTMEDSNAHPAYINLENLGIEKVA